MKYFKLLEPRYLIGRFFTMRYAFLINYFYLADAFWRICWQLLQLLWQKGKLHIMSIIPIVTMFSAIFHIFTFIYSDFPHICPDIFKCVLVGDRMQIYHLSWFISTNGIVQEGNIKKELGQYKYDIITRGQNLRHAIR